MFGRILVFIIGAPVGFWVVRYKDRIVNMVGKMELAEKYLGDGGTYNMWVVIGMGIILGSFMYMIGIFPGQ